MTLDVQQTDLYLNRSVYCRPYYGWQWGRHGDESLNGVDFFQSVVEPAGDMRVVITDFFEMFEERRGFVSRIHQPGHPFDQLLLIATTMHVGVFDFTDHLCTRYDVEIGTQMPAGVGWPIDSGYFGHVWVAASRDRFEEL